MAKAHSKGPKQFDGEVADFSDPSDQLTSGPAGHITDDGSVENVRGADLQADIEAIRQRRASDRALRGGKAKRRRITNYVDAERLRRLHAAGHTHLVTNDELVDCEEAGFFDVNGMQSTNVVTPGTPNGEIAPPQAPTPSEDE